MGAPCHENGTGAGAVFVQAVIYNPGNRTLSTYPPLVIDAGTTPAISPMPAHLPKGAVVGLWGGGNDTFTKLVGAGAAQCVNGADGRLFGQVFFCGAAHFFSVVNTAGLAIPALGLTSDGQPCPSTRSFQIVDQDQSDNIQTTYLVTASGQTAQNTAENRAALGNAVVATNGSDNRLLTNFLDPALGCTPWRIPDIADAGNLLPTQATDELQAAAFQAAPVALIPAGDPMVGPNSLNMVNAYRRGVDQPIIARIGQASTAAYCKHLLAIAPAFLSTHQAAFQASASPDAGMNLYDFLVSRLNATRVILGCP